MICFFIWFSSAESEFSSVQSELLDRSQISWPIAFSFLNFNFQFEIQLVAKALCNMYIRVFFKNSWLQSEGGINSAWCVPWKEPLSLARKGTPLPGKYL
jgi:hypothetical protein